MVGILKKGMRQNWIFTNPEGRPSVILMIESKGMGAFLVDLSTVHYLSEKLSHHRQKIMVRGL
ncbi:hypothetical protein CQJ27_25915 [Escherichia sp. E1130]|nr:hypothetical protein CQJ27_25915 [Escherichia sp. E1130]